MRCLICQKYSFRYICHSCISEHLSPTLGKRVLPNTLEVYYFYKYQNIKDIIKSKYYFIGYAIYSTLSRLSFTKFASSFRFDDMVYILPVDTRFKNGYSNTNILAHALKSKYLKPLYNKLIPTTNINYAGKDLNFRLKNPKKFKYTYKAKINVILVDDTVVTGTTLMQAQKELMKHDVEVLFAITLCDAKE